jgi:hypothetical protein
MPPAVSFSDEFSPQEWPTYLKKKKKLLLHFQALHQCFGDYNTRLCEDRPYGTRRHIRKHGRPVSIRSHRSTTCWTSTLEFSAFALSPSSSTVGSLIEFEGRVQTRRGEERLALILVLEKGKRELEDVAE